MNHHFDKDHVVALLCSIIIVLLGTVFFVGAWKSWDSETSEEPETFSVQLTPFASPDEYRQFMIKQASVKREDSMGLNFAAPSIARSALGESDALSSDLSAGARVSETNVQVRGIDEPDIVKANSEHLFISSEATYTYSDDLLLREKAISETTSLAPDSVEPSSPSFLPVPTSGQTRVLTTEPADQLSQIATIENSGNLFLTDTTLVVLGSSELTGYDIRQASAPSEQWQIDFQDYVVSSRLIGDTMYVVTSRGADSSTPCPLEIASIDTHMITVPCDRLYHPTSETSVDTTYTILAIDVTSGETSDTVSFLANSSNATIYFSASSAYVALTLSKNSNNFYLDFYKADALTLFPSSVQERIQTVLNYQLSDAATMTEIESLVADHIASLPEIQQEQLSNRLSDRLTQYIDSRKRELIQTAITKVSLDTLDVTAQGAVPGQVLNQFSLDEYEDHLRVATTSGSSWFLGSGTATNDIYVLNAELQETGSLQDLGLDETIHSARFVGDRGYLVTFKQTDPFFVLDLSNPKQPQLAGELKLPGFSSYLDPLSDSLVLGIGQENGSVKLSLFDVSVADQPKELDTVLLNEYWSEAQSNHHAFLHDAKHLAFVLPGGSNGAYVFSYADNTLTQVTKAGAGVMKRSIFIDDVLYLIGESEVITINENSWQQLGTFVLP